MLATQAGFCREQQGARLNGQVRSTMRWRYVIVCILHIFASVDARVFP
jgi:hypothetical protein